MAMKKKDIKNKPGYPENPSCLAQTGFFFPQDCRIYEKIIIPVKIGLDTDRGGDVQSVHSTWSL